MTLRAYRLSRAIAAAILISSAGSDQAVSIVNGRFETGADPGVFTELSTSFGSTNITGWEIVAGSIDYIGSYWTASDGNRSLDMNGTTPGAIRQLLTGLVVGQKYTIKFDMAGNPDGSPTDKVLSAVAASAGSNVYHFDVTGKSRTDMQWKQQSFVFTALNKIGRASCRESGYMQ